MEQTVAKAEPRIIPSSHWDFQERLQVIQWLSELLRTVLDDETGQYDEMDVGEIATRIKMVATDPRPFLERKRKEILEPLPFSRFPCLMAIGGEMIL